MEVNILCKKDNDDIKRDDIKSDDIKTNDFLNNLKNEIFKNNIFDNENKRIVNSIYLQKKTKLGKNMTTMIWQFYRHRGKLNVNDVIKKYGREKLVINYKVFQ
jgi:hypothetical protein